MICKIELYLPNTKQNQQKLNQINAMAQQNQTEANSYAKNSLERSNQDP